MSLDNYRRQLGPRMTKDQKQQHQDACVIWRSQWLRLYRDSNWTERAHERFIGRLIQIEVELGKGKFVCLSLLLLTLLVRSMVLPGPLLEQLVTLPWWPQPSQVNAKFEAKLEDDSRPLVVRI